LPIYFENNFFFITCVLSSVVLDEVDVLYGEEGFEQVLQSLIAAAPMSVQYLFVTATLPLEIYNKVVEVFPDCEVIMGPGMHRTSSGLEEVDLSMDLLALFS
jgi:ATP-dependent RNA helicase DDX18/HAS1